MKSETSQTAKSGFRPLLLGFGVILSAFLLATGFSSPFVATLGADAMLLFFRFSLAGAIACGIGFVALSSGSRIHYNEDMGTPALQLAIVLGSMMFMLCGVLCLIPNINGIDNRLALGFGGLLFGIGAIATFLEWGTVYSELDLVDAARHAGLSLLVTALLTALCFHVPAFVSLPIVVYCVLLIGATIPLGYCIYHIRPLNTDVHDLLTWSEIMHRIWMPQWRSVLGTLIAGFAVGLIWGPIAAMREHESLDAWHAVLGIVIAVICLEIAIRQTTHSDAIDHLDIVLVPAAIMVIFILTATGGNLFSPGFVASTLRIFSFASLAAVIWAEMSAAVRTTTLSPWIIFPIVIGLLSLSVCLGSVLSFAAWHVGLIICMLASFAYLIIAVVGVARSASRKYDEVTK